MLKTYTSVQWKEQLQQNLKEFVNQIGFLNG